MTFPNGRSFVPTFTSLDTATIEPNSEAGTSRDDDGAPAESADASIAAGAVPFCPFLGCPCQPTLCVCTHNWHRPGFGNLSKIRGGLD